MFNIIKMIKKISSITYLIYFNLKLAKPKPNSTAKIGALEPTITTDKNIPHKSVKCFIFLNLLYKYK